MTLDILCEVDIPDPDSAQLDAIAHDLGITREEAIRRAVALLAAECVPIHARRSRKRGAHVRGACAAVNVNHLGVKHP